MIYVLLIGLIVGCAGFAWISWASREMPDSPINSIPHYEILASTLDVHYIQALKDISAERLRSTILELQDFKERYSCEKQALVSRFLLERLKALGLRPEVQEYHYENQTYRNLVITFPGKNQPHKRLLAIAHYDTKNWIKGQLSPGADDNATGVSGLLELARIIGTLDRRQTWQLVFASNEEQGRKGSIEFARRAKESGADIAGVIALDVVGYHPPGTSELLRVAGSSMNAGRKLKGIAKVFYNAYLAQQNNSIPLKIAFRTQDLSLSPKAALRTAFGRSVFWELGGACP